MIPSFRHYLLLATLCITATFARAQVDSVMQSVTLESVEVSAPRYTAKLKFNASGQMVIDRQLWERLPSIMGVPDPLRFTQLLPEVQTNGEFRAGINLQGSESSHNMVAIGSIPVYNASHLLGFFSTFNASHYDRTTLSKHTDATSPNRLGGVLSIEALPHKADSLRAEIAIGTIASQATLQLPIGRHTSCKASVRASYINQLYDQWMRDDDMSWRYAFYDMNLTLLHQFDHQHSLVVDYYGGNDQATYEDDSYTAQIRAKWGNQILGIRHLYDSHDRLRMTNQLYLTSYRNRPHLTMQDLDIRLPSGIWEVGFLHQAAYGLLSWGADLVAHHIHPQALQTTSTILPSQEPTTATTPLEIAAYANYRHPLSASLHFDAGLRASAYGSPATGYFAHLSPSLSVTYHNDEIEAFVGYALKHQYLFQTGFSEVGLPSEFWMSASQRFQPQYAHTINAGLATRLLARRYKMSASVFYKQLHRQMEYTGSVFDFVNKVYHLEDHLWQGRGENYGCSLSLHKVAGKMTGWLSYTYTHARRTFAKGDRQEQYPASHERPHELNAVMSYTLTRHWALGSTFVMASGTPFTPIDYIALINSNVISHFGEHNSHRFKSYARVDVSLSYKWKSKRGRERGVHLSVYNLTGRHNDLFYYVHIAQDGQLSYRPRSFISAALPAISYYFKL